MDDFRRENTRDLPELRNDIAADRIIDKQQRQRRSALLLPPQVHSCDVDLAFAENGSDGADDSRLIVVRKEDHVSVRHHLERIAVDIYDARQFIGEHGS